MATLPRGLSASDFAAASAEFTAAIGYLTRNNTRGTR